MKLSDVFNAQAIALNYTTVAGNALPYIGPGFFPAKKKAGLDLKWIIGANGLPVSLMPSNFDAKSTFRDRIGIQIAETEMPFFRESMLVKEADEQEIMRVQDSNDPYAVQVLENIFNDARTLVDGANVVPERMIMQLLAPVDGDMKINISANNVAYSYDYDPSDTWKSKHYTKLTGTDKWSDATHSTPLKDIEDALDQQEAAGGNRPTVALMNKTTFNYLKASSEVRSAILAQNLTANINMTTNRVRQYIQEEYNLNIVVYTKKYKNEAGAEANFYPTGMVMFLPGGAIGTTWYGTTPEERTLMGQAGANVSIVNTGVAVAVTTTSDPVNTKTTASEIVLPSFENMNLCYCLQV